MRLTKQTTLILILGDLLLFLLFSGLGRAFHQMPLSLTEILFTSFPFIFSWLIIASTLELFQAKGLTSLAQTFFRTGAAVMLSITIAIWLRAWMLQHPFDWLFWVVTLLTMLALFLIWRLIFTWFHLKYQTR